MGPESMIAKKRRRQRGFSLIESMIAIVVLTVGLLSVLGLFGFATTTNSTQGDYGTRSTEYAQGKIEQLMGLAFNDSASTTVGNITLTSGGNGLTPGGSVTANAPVTGYVDYVDSLGDSPQAQVPTSGLYYIRQWQITANADGTKTLVVFVQVIGVPNGAGGAPSTTLASIKADI